MCATYIFTFAVSVIDGLVNSVLHNYRLNVQRNSTSCNQADTTDNTNIEDCKWKGTLKTSDTEQHPDHYYLKYNEDDNHLDSYLFSDTQRDALLDFGLRYDVNDFIYEEFIPSDNDNDRLAWRLSRPSAYAWFWECIKTSFYITVLSGLFVGAATVFLMFIDINTVGACSTLKWNEIPVNVQQVVVAADSTAAWIIQWLPFISMYCIFGWSLIRDLHLMSWTICAAFIDAVTCLCLQIYNMYDVNWKNYSLNVVFVLTLIINSYKIANHFHNQKMSRKVILTFQLGSQYLLGAVTVYGVIYLLLPWFIDSSPLEQVIIAAVTSLVCVVPKLVSRLAAQTLIGINHPGTSYVLVLGSYAPYTILIRIMQANESLDMYVLFSFVHGIVGLLERLSVVTRDHFYIWFYKKVLKRENLYWKI